MGIIVRMHLTDVDINEDVDWILLAQGMVQWRILVKTTYILGFMRREEFFDELRDQQLLKKDSAKWNQTVR
jgi:hypothetical protein